MMLFKYFTVVFGVLLSLLVLASSLLEPSSSPQSAVKPTPKVIVQHDPQASLFERGWAEERAQKAAAKGETLAAPIITVEPVTPVPQHARSARPTSEQAQAETLQVSAQAPVRTATATPEPSARAVLPDKRVKAERLRKERLTRERARNLQAESRRQRLARERARTLHAASRHQDQLYYGYAPQPTYGPFGWWGQAQRW